jgi:hypothetical protein
MLYLLSKSTRAAVFLGTLGLTGLAVVCQLGDPGTAHAQTKDTKTAPAKVEFPPAEDVNELSMEVAALRALYLLKAGPLQLKEGKRRAEVCAEKPRQRQPAKVSPNYRKVLTELRAAFVTGKENRIEELSEQLEDLTNEESPYLDDEVEITQEARQRARTWLVYFEADAIVKYLAAYGKDFPSPRDLLVKTLRLDGKSKTPTPEEWKETRAFVIREVSWMVAGLDLEKAKAQKVGEKVANLLDRGYALSDAELAKQKTSLLNEINAIAHLPPTDVIAHVIEQDLAELLSNPRLASAITTRQQFLKKAGAAP